MGVQAPRQKQLLRYYREAGYRVVAGGSYASLCPEEYLELADHVVAGEAEYIWPQFCADFEAEASRDAVPRDRQREAAKTRRCRASICSSSSATPPPRCSSRAAARSAASSATSSSCSAAGRATRPRRRSGASSTPCGAWARARCSSSTTTSSATRRAAKETLRFLAGLPGAPRPASALRHRGLAQPGRRPGAARLFRDAGFEWVFLGIETPDPATLREAAKTQNCTGDMLAAVRRIHAAGIDVLAGFIVGFDHDTPASFERAAALHPRLRDHGGDGRAAHRAAAHAALRAPEARGPPARGRGDTATTRARAPTSCRRT